MPKHGAFGRFASWVKMASMAFAVLVGIMESSYATPIISDLKVTPVEPVGLVLDYTINGATTNDLKRLLEVMLVVNNITNVAKSLIGATNCVNGAHRVYWNVAKDCASLDKANMNVTVSYSKYMEGSLYCVIDLSGGASATSYPVFYLDFLPDDCFTNEVYKTTRLVLRCCPAGRDSLDRYTLTKPFYMGVFEITQKQWELVMGTNVCVTIVTGSGKKGDQYESYEEVVSDGDAYPVYYVSYAAIRGSVKGTRWPSSDVVDGELYDDSNDSFLGRLRRRTGLPFDLPTEAQWEYACRAGTTTTYSYGDSEDGNYMGYLDLSGKSHEADFNETGAKKPNKWGLYDMHGNVWEWCLDWYDTLAYGSDPKGPDSGLYRVLRGGSCSDKPFFCTSSYRGYANPSEDGSSRSKLYGFRIARTLP